MNAHNTIDPKKFRNALGNFATGVTVITTDCEEVGKVGMTANSFNSVSLDPPMVLWSIAKTSRALDFFQSAGKFCVNVLAADQVSMSNHFASKSPDKFADVAWHDGETGVPVLDDVAAAFECETAFVYEGGDHLIFVGNVMEFADTGRKALLYHGGRYAVSNPHPANTPDPAADEPRSSGFVNDYLDYLLAKATDNFERGFQLHLDRRNVGKYEWRTLVTLNDYDGISLDKLADIVLLEHKEFEQLLQEMIERKLIKTQGSGEPLYVLTPSGEEEVTHLLAAAKAHEVDSMGTFTLEESLILKSLLKRLV